MKETENAIYMSQEEYDDYLEQHARDIEALVKENPNKPIATMSLYELNQSIMAIAPTMTHKQIENAVKKVVVPWLKKNGGEVYFALLNNEARYYTIFRFNNHKRDYDFFVQEFVETVEHIGDIKGIEEDNNGAIAIWGTFQHELNADAPVRCFYMFPYTTGVVEI